MKLFNLFKKKSQVQKRNTLPFTQLTILETKKEFEDFISLIQIRIQHVKILLNKSQLSYSIDEIKSFEEFYYSNFKKSTRINISVEEFQKIFETYIGTAFLWHFGGEWYVDLNINTHTYGQYYIVDFGGKDFDALPVNIIDWRTIVENKEIKDGIYKIIENKIRFFELSPEFKIEPIRNFN